LLLLLLLCNVKQLTAVTYAANKDEYIEGNNSILFMHTILFFAEIIQFVAW